jgi:23S rRNA pseudouridine2604 synthase
MRPAMTTEPVGIRLNKFISDTGVCSRREADKLIEAGRVQINGQKAELGTRVTPADRVTVNGEPLGAKPRRVFLAYHKPPGITCTTDRRVEDNIVDAVGFRERVYPVGRLDKFSEGLIFLTNDGDSVNKILRAGNAHEKEYVVVVDHPITDDFIAGMAGGVPILDTVTRPCQVKRLTTHSFNIILTQGLNRQIRRMCEHFGYRVLRLKRVRIMLIKLGELKLGHWRMLTDDEQSALTRLLAKSSNAPAAETPDDDE